MGGGGGGYNWSWREVPIGVGLLSGDGLIIGAREGAPIRGVTIGARGGSYREEAYNWI